MASSRSQFDQISCLRPCRNSFQPRARKRCSKSRRFIGTYTYPCTDAKTLHTESKRFSCDSWVLNVVSLGRYSSAEISAPPASLMAIAIAPPVSPHETTMPTTVAQCGRRLVTTS